MILLNAVQFSAGFDFGEDVVSAPDGSEGSDEDQSIQRNRYSSVATRLIAPIFVATRTTSPVVVVACSRVWIKRAILPVSASSRLFVFAATASIVLDIRQIR